MQGRAGQSKTGQGWAGLTSTLGIAGHTSMQGRAGQGRAGQGRAGQGRAHNPAGLGRAHWHAARQGSPNAGIDNCYQA